MPDGRGAPVTRPWVCADDRSAPKVVLGQRGFTGEEAAVVSVTSDLGALPVVDGKRVRDPDIRADSARRANEEPPESDG